MADFDVDAMLVRYTDRAQAVRDRPLPPVAGQERQKFIDQAQTDYTDYALIASAEWSVVIVMGCQLFFRETDLFL